MTQQWKSTAGADRELQGADQRTLIGYYFSDDWSKKAAAELLDHHARVLAAKWNSGPNMFWDAAYPEDIYPTLDEAMNAAQGTHGLMQGSTLEIQQGIRLTPLQILVTDGDDEGDHFKYEVTGEGNGTS